MSARTLRLIGYLFGAIALALVAIWILQEFGVVAWLDDPATGAIGPAIIAMMLVLLADRKSPSK